MNIEELFKKLPGVREATPEDLKEIERAMGEWRKNAVAIDENTVCIEIAISQLTQAVEKAADKICEKLDDIALSADRSVGGSYSLSRKDWEEIVDGAAHIIAGKIR